MLLVRLLTTTTIINLDRSQARSTESRLPGNSYCRLQDWLPFSFFYICTRMFGREADNWNAADSSSTF